MRFLRIEAPSWRLLGVMQCVLLAASPAAPAQTPQGSPQALVQQMVNNDLKDRDQGSFWQYHIEKTVDGQHKSEEQVDTQKGPVYRVLAIDGKPLDAEQQRAEQQRVTYVLQHPAEQEKVKQQHDDDEARVRKLMELLPQGFLYEMDGMDANTIRLRFRPNPEFDPPSYEDRVFHALAGTLTMDAKQKRLLSIKGQLFNDVEFGFGLLGRINKGSTFEIARQPVNPSHWKTNRVDVHVSGHIILFKTVSKQQDEVRSNFRQVANDLTVQQAFDLLQGR